MTHFQKNTFLIGMIFIALGIVFGAFGAHGLQGKISAEKIVSFETGVRYQMYHGFALLFLGLISPYLISSLKWSFRLMILGTFFFSFSIYLLAIQELFGISISKALGPITPIGGLLLIISWLILIVNLVKQKSLK